MSNMAASLFVGNLAETITKSDLYVKFRLFGEIHSVVICRDSAGHSLGHGYINYKKLEDPQLALKTATDNLLEGQTSRISWSRNGSSHTIPRKYYPYTQNKAGRQQEVSTNLNEQNVNNCKLYVNNFDGRVNAHRLRSEFSAFGNVIDARVIKENGYSKGFGFVTFSNLEEATKAKAAMNGHRLDRNILYVNFAKQKADAKQQRKNDHVNYTQAIYHANYHSDSNGSGTKSQGINEEEQTVDLAIPQAVSFDNDEQTSAQLAFKTIIDSFVGRQASRFSRCRNDSSLYISGDYCPNFRKKADCHQEISTKLNEKNLNNFNLYVRNFDDTINAPRLCSEFSAFGNVINARVIGENGRSKGYGFVTFSNLEEATKAQAAMNGYRLNKNILYVDFVKRDAKQ